MRIAFDGRLLQGSLRGMGVYAASLLKAMPARLHGHSMTVILDGRRPSPPADVVAGLETKTAGGPGGVVMWEQVYLPLAARGFDLLHSPANGAPVFAPCPVVLTLHDAIFMRRWREISAVPYPRQLAGHLYRTRVHPVAARRASAVITVSEASKAEIAAIFRIPAGRIAVTPEALAESFRRCEPLPKEALRSRFGLHGPFMLALGAYERRKNIPLLFRVVEKLSASSFECPTLVLAGAENLAATVYPREVRERKIESLVRFLPYLDDSGLKRLYGSASAFLMPSRREGFGLPLLEAMSCGTPVVASDIPCHREVAGEAALLVGPDDEAGWVAAVKRVLGDQVLRERLRRAGLDRVGAFSWDRAAQQTVAVYDGLR